MHPRFSIVIPTRERAHTLPFTLRTCLAQEFNDFEVIVADNASVAPIQGIVDSFSDKRIQYVRTPHLLAMTDSWEFALSKATGEFITIIGNDDGLLLHGLHEIDRLIRMLSTQILRWESVCYNWPDLPIQEHAQPNALLIPLKQSHGYYPIHRRDSTNMMLAAANSRLSYTELPMIQSAAIHRDLIERLRQKTGRVFQSRSPDIYSSFAFAYLAGSYFSVNAPMTINGLSGKSNGVAFIYLGGKTAVAEEFNTLNGLARHARHPLSPDVFVMPAAVADSFFHAKDGLFPDDSAITLDRNQLSFNCIREARIKSDEDWQRIRAAIRDAYKDDRELTEWFDREFEERAFESLDQTRHAFKRYGGDYLYLDAADFGVSNIFEAAQLCEKLLGCKREGVNAHLVNDASPTIIQQAPVEAAEVLPMNSHRPGIWQRLQKAANLVIHGCML